MAPPAVFSANCCQRPLFAGRLCYRLPLPSGSLSAGPTRRGHGHAETIEGNNGTELRSAVGLRIHWTTVMPARGPHAENKSRTTTLGWHSSSLMSTAPPENKSRTKVWDVPPALTRILFYFCSPAGWLTLDCENASPGSLFYFCSPVRLCAFSGGMARGSFGRARGRESEFYY